MIMYHVAQEEKKIFYKIMFHPTYVPALMYGEN